MTQQEWEQEFNNLLDDMTMQDGRAILAEPDQNSPTYASWCKLYAVFGDNYTCSTRDSGERASRIPCFVYLRFWAAILYGITPKIVNSLEVGNRKRLLMHRQSSLLLPHAACRVNPRLFHFTVRRLSLPLSVLNISILLYRKCTMCMQGSATQLGVKSM